MTATVSRRTWPLVGREKELELIGGAMGDDECGGVALFGTAGVGKTRLAGRARELAIERGMPTASVRANRSASEIPFGALAPWFSELDLPVEVTAGQLRAVADAVEQRRGGHRLVLVVDDAQELDDASGALLDHLLHTGSVFVVLTARMGHREASAVDDMWKDERIQRVDVAPLPDDDLRHLARLALGGPVEGSSLAQLVGASAGNVLFLRELVNGALESGVLGQQQGMWRLTGSLVRSPRLRDLIEQRLRVVSEAERRVLELVALGEPLELSLIASLAEPVTVETLEARGVVETEPTPGGPEIRFSHPLFGEVVRTGMSLARRSRLSRLLADAADAGAVTGRPLRAAVWRLDGGGPARPETTMTAAREAFVSEDYALAARLAGSVWESTGDFRAALLVADALDLTGRVADVETLMVRAAPLAADDGQRTDIAVRRASAFFRLPDGGPRAAEVLDEAMASVQDPACRRRLLNQQARHLLMAGEVARAIEVDAALGDDPSLPAVWRDLGVALALAGRTDEAVRRAGAALTACLAGGEEELTAAAVFLVALAVAHYEAGSLTEAEQLSRAGYQVATERRNTDGQAWLASVLGLVLCTEGRLEQATHYFVEAAVGFEALGHPGRRWALGGVALAAGQMGDADAASAALHQMDAMAPSAVHMMDVAVGRGRAWALAAAGDMAAARRHLWAAVELAASWGQLAEQAAALHDLMRLGEGRPARDGLRLLAGRVDGGMMAARLDLAAAEEAEDADRAASASARFEALGATLFAAEAAGLEARLATAGGLARRAAAAASRMEHLAASCEQPRTPGLTAAAGSALLSRREHEVAVLASRGLSSREIAVQLCVSPRTVDNHLQRVYTKLGLRGRHQLAGRLAGVDGTAGGEGGPRGEGPAGR